MNLNVFFEGFGMSAGLIIAIGAQNAYVLKQGIKRQNVLLIAFLCSIIDTFLIICGVIGMGELINRNKTLLIGATVLGILFLAYYSLRSFRGALNPPVYSDSSKLEEKQSKIKTALTVGALSLLNPHVYIDTVLLLGSIGSRYPLNERYIFALGASLASITWFFSLSFGAGKLAPLFKKKKTWQILDFVIGIIMVLIIIQLIFFLIKG